MKTDSPAQNSLSILIPARNEEFLQNTIDDIFEHAEGDTEVIVGLDGWHTELKKHPRLKVIHRDKPLGQRAMTNLLAGYSNAKYVAKTDAHCSFAQGFDVKLMELMEDDLIMTPILARLHAFDWKCECGVRTYQDTKPECHEVHKETVWQVVPKPFTKKYYFDQNFVFQYWPHEETSETLVETMALQGSFFMLTRQKYWELDICDEKLGSWGFQGVETALKGWLSGMRVVTNTNTYYGHMFRTSDIPYSRPQEEIDEVHQKTRDLWLNNKWDKQIRPLSWLIEKFGPPGWDEEAIKTLKNQESVL